MGRLESFAAIPDKQLSWLQISIIKVTNLAGKVELTE